MRAHARRKSALLRACGFAALAISSATRVAALPSGAFQGHVIGTSGVVTRTATDSDTKAGWTAGGGVEYAFRNHWSLGVEYLYMDFGSTTLNQPAIGPLPASSASFDDKSHVVRAKVNYKFDWTTPITR